MADIPNHSTSFDNILEIFLWKGICSTYHKSVTNFSLFSSSIILLALTLLNHILLKRLWQIDVPSWFALCLSCKTLKVLFLCCLQPLKRALARMGAPNLVPDNMDNSLSYSVITYLKKLKNQVRSIVASSQPWKLGWGKFKS